MPTLAGFNGASVVPNVTGAIQQGGQAFGAVRQLGRENAADDAAMQAAGGDMDALALLSRLDPNAGQMVGTILQNKDAKAAAELAAQKEKRVREAAMWLQTDPKDRQAALLQMATGLRDTGEDFSHLVQFSQMDPQRQEAEARRIIAMGAGIDQVLKPLFRGDSKQQMGAGVVVEIDGQQYFSNPIFNPDGGTSRTNLTPVAGGTPLEVSNSTLEGMQGAGRAQIVSRTTGLSAGGQAQMDANAAGMREEQVQLARQRAERFGQAQDAAGVLGTLDEMERLVNAGVYGGGLLDRAGRLAANAGVPFDEAKAANTVQLRQMATTLKLMTKPPGMGAMSDSEWKILQESIPNPDSGTPEQILAGIESFRRQLQQRAGQPPGQTGGTGVINEETDALLKGLGL